jgi:hypothetical protein
MIVHLNTSVAQNTAEELGRKYEAICFHNGRQYVLVTSSKVKEADTALKEVSEAVFITDSDIQLASKQYMTDTRSIDTGACIHRS